MAVATIFRHISKSQNLSQLRNLTTFVSPSHAPKPFINPYLGHLSNPTAARLPYCSNPTNGAVMQGMNYPLLPLKITPEKREEDLHSAIQRTDCSVVKEFMDSMGVGMISHQSEELLEEELIVTPHGVHEELLMSDESYAAAVSSLTDAVLEYNYFAMGIRCATKKIKFAKMRKGRMGGISHRGNVISFGNYALQVLDCAWITAKQLEAGRRALSRIVGRGAKIWVRAIPDKPVTERPAETRMGRGKGAVSYYVAVVQPGRILYEISGVTESIARKGVDVAASKLPVRTRFIITDTA